MITQARLKELLDYDPETGVFVCRVRRSNHKALAGHRAGCPDKDGYIRIGLERKKYCAHVLAWLYVTGEWPSKQLDHINTIRSDNRFENLREASRGENMQNGTRRADNTSGFKCVSWDVRRGKWCAYINADGVRTHLGRFDVLDDAVSAVAEARACYHKEFGRAA